MPKLQTKREGLATSNASPEKREFDIWVCRFLAFDCMRRVRQLYVSLQVFVGKIPERVRTRPTLMRWALIAAGIIFFLPCDFFDIRGFGLESSWRLILNKGVSDGWEFGSRLIWTYGPLGFLDSRVPYGIPVWYYAAFDFFMLALFLLITFKVINRISSGFKLMIVCPFFIKLLVSESPSCALFAALGMLFAINLEKPGWLVSIAIALSSTLLFFFKMNFGTVGLLLSFAVFLLRIFQRHREARNWGFLLAGQLALISVLALPLHVQLLEYVKNSLAFIRLYSTGMSAGPGLGGVPHFASCIFMAAYLVLGVVGLKRQHFELETTARVLVCTAIIFILFKSSVVRSDFLHNRLFLFGLPLVLFVFLLCSPDTVGRLWKPLLSTAAVYAGLLLIVEHGHFLLYTSKQDLKAFFPVDFALGIKSYSEHQSWSDYERQVSIENRDRLVPENVRRLIGTNSVDVFPFEASLPLSSGLDYHPRPIPQTYAVLGKGLEDANVRFYLSKEAPSFVLYVLGERAKAIDHRYFLWEEPRLKRILRERFRAATMFTNMQGTITEIKPGPTPVMVLQKLNPTNEVKVCELFATQEHFGRRFDLPHQKGELYARIALKKTLLGRFVDFVYRGDLVQVSFYLEDVSVKNYRFIPSMAEVGVLMNRFADENNPDALVNYLYNKSDQNPRCIAMKFECEGGWEYYQAVRVEYFTLGISHREPSTH